jgi:hypothetical protein
MFGSLENHHRISKIRTVWSVVPDETVSHISTFQHRRELWPEDNGRLYQNDAQSLDKKLGEKPLESLNPFLQSNWRRSVT